MTYDFLLECLCDISQTWNQITAYLFMTIIVKSSFDRCSFYIINVHKDFFLVNLIFTILCSYAQRHDYSYAFCFKTNINLLAATVIFTTITKCHFIYDYLRLIFDLIIVSWAIDDKYLFLQHSTVHQSFIRLNQWIII